VAGWRTFALVGAGTVLALVVLSGLAIAEAAFLRDQAARGIGEAQAIRNETGVDEHGFVEIGGIRQWITIRGRDRSNPVILMLHGGPGGSMEAESWYFRAGWEDYFTVVQWDQRGAGKTYAANDPAKVSPTIGFERMLADASEVTDYLRRRLHQDKIIVVGHSWGSLLGLTLAKRRPDALCAYVGMGQVIDMPDNEQASYQSVLGQARAARNAKAVKDLEGIAPYPPKGVPPIEKLIIERRWVARFGDVWGGVDGDPELPLSMLSPNASALETLSPAAEYSTNLLLGEMFHSIDMRKNGSEYQIPIFFFDGARDLGAPTNVAKAYFDTIKAPAKAFVTFPGAGHFVMMERPGATLVHLVNEVRPFALKGSGGG
jgi:pimeloyl-ACP methyl ester carboxylesterase